jgi:stage II sporulation protein Q
MKKKIKLKVVPFVILSLFLLPLLYLKLNHYQEKDIEEVEEIISIPQETLPVISDNNIIGVPYNNPSVMTAKEYYDYKSDDEHQQKSLTYYDDTYYQNDGIDYNSEEVFDVLTILDGTVLEIRENDKTGKEIKIEHENGLVSIYQSLSEIFVKKGDLVTKGQVIGKSGTNEIEKELGNHLHFELYDNGKTVNPNNYLNQEYKKEN